VTDQKTEEERRHYQRIPFIADVLVSHEQLQWSCALEDISLKGLLLVGPPSAEPQKDLSYAIELVLGEGAIINMTAQISHIEGDHWGLQWDNIELEGLMHLRRLLELNMDDPEQMHRELAELG